ncbi:acyltransferase family protein [Deinococcus radiotolerans]|uniref:acyltransferase family protein n=1 Tax=Deinococcus radiotolerans TaxID=1309407 RepID=UPI0016636F8F|nr:acyltransferase [Deinococcus radiotolerans]
MTAPPTWTSRIHLDKLTGVRFLAAILVVLFHFTPPVQERMPVVLQNLLSNGFVGVSFFFVLSGFILTYSYATPSGMRGSDRTFWWARFARIYPLYLLALAMKFPVYFVKGEYSSYLDAAIDFLSSVFLVQAWIPTSVGGINPPGWSLSAEAFFYLLFPFILPIIQRTKINFTSIIFALWLASFLPVYLLHSNGIISDETAYYLPLFHLPQFVIGVLFGWVMVSSPTGHFATISKKISSIIALGILIILAFTRMPMSTLNNGILAPLFGILFIGLAQGMSRASWLGSSGMVLLGQASFGIYILQMPVGSWFKYLSGLGSGELNGSQILIYIAVLIIFSILAFKFFEQPLQKLIMRIVKSRSDAEKKGTLAEH